MPDRKREAHAHRYSSAPGASSSSSADPYHPPSHHHRRPSSQHCLRHPSHHCQHFHLQLSLAYRPPRPNHLQSRRSPAQVKARPSARSEDRMPYGRKSVIAGGGTPSAGTSGSCWSIVAVVREQEARVFSFSRVLVPYQRSEKGNQMVAPQGRTQVRMATRTNGYVVEASAGGGGCMKEPREAGRKQRQTEGVG